MKQSSYLRRGGKELSKLKREERWFDSQRETVLLRDGNKCTECGETQNLVVHHIDSNGRGSKNPNNSLENLKTLCRSCHAKEHLTLDKWSRDFDQCVSCGTMEVKHRAKGLCVNCYELSLRRAKNPNPKILNPGQWSFDYPSCLSCSTTSIKHKGNGLCLVCYGRAKYKRNK